MECPLQANLKHFAQYLIFLLLLIGDEHAVEFVRLISLVQQHSPLWQLRGIKLVGIATVRVAATTSGGCCSSCSLQAVGGMHGNTCN